MTVIFGSGFFVSCLRCYVGTSAIVTGLWALGAICAGIPAIISGYTYLTDTNTKKIEVYFDEVIKELEKKKQCFVKTIEIKKYEFIEKLEKSNKITSKEIKLLKEYDYERRLKNFMKIFK